MSTRKFFSLITAVLLSQLVYSQTVGDTCTFPIDMGGVPDVSSGYITDDRIESWYSFQSIFPVLKITVTNSTSAPGLYNKVVLYKGICGGLAPLDSAESFGDTIFTLERNFMAPDVYYIKVSQPTPCKTCTAPFVTADLRIEQGIEPWCGFDAQNNFVRSTNPGYTIQMTAQDQYIYNYITTHSSTAGPFTIPVVVHVIHYGDGYGSGNNISYDQILWQIAGLNAGFQHDYANYNQEGYGHNYVGYGQQDYSSNPQVRFCLAERGRDSALNVIPFFYNTMSGDTECGVMRYNLTLPMYASIPNVDSLNSYNITNTADEQTLMDVTRPGTEFPNGMYFNIYLVPEMCETTPNGTSCGVIGIGTMGTFNSLTGQMDGVVFRTDVFGDNSVAGNTFNLFAPLQEGKIMDHEAGHYLALYHTFQPDSAQNIGCFGTQPATAAFNQCDRHGDFCCDTPPDANPVVQPFVFTSTINTCNETYFPAVPASNHIDMNENYMDYSDDNWYNTFTFDQSMRTSAMLDVGGPRHSLVTTSNLALTGVSDTGKCHCCVLVANIVPAGDSICVGSAMQFITPTGNAFCATSWAWQFPGGSPSTSTLPNPIVTYGTAGTYTVILTATDGVDTVTSTATINVVNVTVTISATNTIDTVCSGTHQHLELDFTGGLTPYSVTICDQNNNVVATVNNIYSDSAVIVITVSDTSNHFFICSATNGLGCMMDTIIGNAAFEVQECCDNLFVNGDFEDFGPGCNIAPSTSDIPCGLSGTGFYNTYNPLVPFSGWPLVPPFSGQNGNSMVIDCPTNPVNNTPIFHTILCRQTISLEQGVHYSLQYDYSSNYGNLSTTNLSPYLLNSPNHLFLQISVNGTFIGTPIEAEYCNNGALWHTYVVDWISTLPTGNYAVSICQVDSPNPFDVNFSNGGFDFLIDNISVRAMDIPSALAGLDTTICPGNYANIGSILNDTDGVYTWSPNNFVVCDTCFLTSANPDTTYEYILTNQQRGCTVHDTVVVSVLHVFAGNDTAFCGGGSITLNAIVTSNPNGHSTLWQPGGQTTDAITVSPTVATTYIVTVTDSMSGCSVSDTVTVSPSLVSVTVNSPKICSGDTALVTSIVTGNLGTFTYLWMPGNQTSSSISVAPAVTTSYTVIVTDSIGCSDTAVATVTVNSASVTASATPNPACIGSFIQLQANASGLAPFAYTWLPTTNLNNPSTSNPTISSYNGSTITYTVFISDANGCEALDSVQITIDPTCCTAQSYTGDTLATSIFNGNYAVNQNLLVVGTITIAATDMLIAPNVSITVASGSTLIITAQSHLHACYQMWTGIIVQPGATLVINSNSLVEDAYVAINYNNATGANIQLLNAIFNKNQITFLAQTWAGALSFNMVNCRVTCRTLPVSPTVALLTSAFLTSLPQSNLIAPLTTQRAFSGVQFMNGGSVNVGVPLAASTNIFDYLDRGVIATNANVTIRNNHFQNMLQPCALSPNCPISGVAITASDPGLIVGNTTTYNTIQIGGTIALAANTFENCWRAIDITRYVNTTIRGNTIFSAATVINPPNTSNLNGDHGIFIRTTYSQVMDVNNNLIRNQATGIHINLSAGGVGYNTINVRDNVVKAGTTTTTVMNRGIQVEGVAGVFFLINNFLNIEGDSVLQAQTCIQVRNIRNAVRVFSNPELHVRPITTAAAGPNQAGIFIQNCPQVFIQDNLNVHSSGTNFSNVNHRNVRGIYVMNSTNSTVCHNVVHHLGQGLVFEGACATSFIRRNDMSFAYDGYVLRTSAVTGQQGDITHPADNRWLGVFANSQTYVEATFTANTASRMFVRGFGVWNPTNNQSVPATFEYNPTPVVLFPTAAVCGVTPPTLASQPLRQQIAQNQINYAVFPNESRFANQRRLFKELEQDPQLYQTDTILQNFYNNNQSGNLGLISTVENQAEQGNVSAAITANNGISGQTASESNQQLFNSIFLSTLMQGIDSLNATQLADLTFIASQCPNEGGDAVLQARAMINWVLHTSIDFIDSCSGSGARYSQGNIENQSHFAQVYPSPNSGEIIVECDLTGIQHATFEVIDLSGRIVFSSVLSLDAPQQKIILDGVANGAYAYKIVGDREVRDTDVLIINR